MSLSSAQVLEKPAPHVVRVPQPRIPLEAAAPTPSAPPAPAVPAAASRRRLPHPPGRRAHLWLAALVAGAVLAGVPAVAADRPDVSLTASDYGLGVSTEVSASGGLEDAEARRGITEAEAQARLGELAASRAAREPDYVVPMSAYRLTTCFCKRWGQMHPGWDMAAPLGTPIFAATDGVVLDAGPTSGFGNAVYIQDAEGNVHIYGHMRYYDVRAGDIVRAGDQIAKVGNEGFSTGPHLHWQIHRGGRNGRAIDPEIWLAERGVSA